MKTNKKIMSFTLAALLLIGLMSGCALIDGNSASESQTQQPGDTDTTKNKYGSLKQFTANTLNGGTFTQDNLKEADITMINFWSIDCPPCIEEMPALGELAKTLPDNVKLITVCFDGDSDADFAKKILSDAGVEVPTLTSGDGDFESVSNKIEYTPTTLFVDSEGNIVGKAIIGSPENPTEEFVQIINDALQASGKPEMK